MPEGIDSNVTRRDNFTPTRPQALADVQGQTINKTNVNHGNYET